MLFKLLLSLILLVPLAASSQTVEVKKAVSRIEGKNTEGYEVIVGDDDEQVKESLTRFLKGLGKTKQAGDYITVPVAVAGEKTYPYPLYATIRRSAGANSVWIGMISASEQDRALEKLVYDFGVSFWREKIQHQIDESLRALQAVEKQQSRLINQNEDLLRKISDNKREKLELEKALEENRLELEALKGKLESNRQARDSVLIAREQIKKVVEMHKEKQRQVK